MQSRPVGSDHSSQPDFTLARSVLPAVACYCLQLSIRLHVSFSSLQRLKCFPKPTAKLRASASLPGSLLGAVSLLTQKITALLHRLSSNCVPDVGIIRTVRGNSLCSLITSYITMYAFCSSVVCSHQ